MSNPRMTPEQARAALAAMTDEDFPTVPLDEVFFEDGRPVTEASIDRLVDAAHAMMDARKGRPSLTTSGGRSPQVTTRLPLALNDRLNATARSTHRRRSQVVRDALEAYLAPV